MSVHEIEAAIGRLSQPELAELAEWFDQFVWQRWDEQIERDSKSGRLDRLINEANREFDAGRCKPL